MVLTRTLYGEEAAKRPDLLPEQDKERIRTLSSAVAAVVGGVAGSRDGGGNAVDVLANAQVGGVVGRNAVENNYYLTPVAASHSEQEAREIYRILKDQIDTTCGNGSRINECRAYIGYIVNFLQDKELSDKYPDLTNQSKRFLANHSDLVESFIRGERQRLEAMDKSAFFRYVIPGSQMVFGAVGVASSVTLGGITCAESAGLGCMGAGVGIIASGDEMTTGARNFGRRASEQQPTKIVQTFMATGMSRDSAETTSLLISLGAAGVSAAPKAGMLFRSSSTARYATAGSFTTTPGRAFSAIPANREGMHKTLQSIESRMSSSGSPLGQRIRGSVDFSETAPGKLREATNHHIVPKVTNEPPLAIRAPSTQLKNSFTTYHTTPNKPIDFGKPIPIRLHNGYYEASGMKISEQYYNKLWQRGGRPAPFLQAREVLQNNPNILPDRKPGFFRYEGSGLELIYNPRTGEIWHIQPQRLNKR